MNNELDAALFYWMLFCSFCICIGLTYCALVWWKACDYRSRGYCWMESLIMAAQGFK